MARKCTIPKIFGIREWWELRFSALCEVHDAHYTEKKISRISADYIYSKGMWEKDYKLLSALSYSGLRAVGWVYWYGIIK